jgi:hypothetical protein
VKDPVRQLQPGRGRRTKGLIPEQALTNPNLWLLLRIVRKPQK